MSPAKSRRVAGLVVPVLAVLGLCSPDGLAAGCRGCHGSAAAGHAPGHAFAAHDCGPCHGGDPSAAERDAAHAGLVAFPGHLDNAARTCGTCHPGQLEGVRASPMTTLRGMIGTTRRVLSGSPGAPGLAGAAEGPARLGSSAADSLLRKLCVSCHLGQPKARHGHDPVRDRGGGCLACHVNGYPPGAHPEVSARVEDARCFGCHSRSARIALSYAGLAELDDGTGARADPAVLARLPDGRLLERRAADRHHRAGLACVDCHTGAELMHLAPPPEADAALAQGPAPPTRSGAGDIRCEDCHGPGRASAPAAALSAWQRARLRSPAGAADPAREVYLTGRRATPLGGLEPNGDGVYLRRKLGGEPIPVPAYRPEDHPWAGAHARLACEACHSQWAPRCYGCHLSYDPAAAQWDHLQGTWTPGRWRERRWDTRNGLPALGIAADGRIRPFVPAMVMTVEHPDPEAPHFRRLFAPIAPHTTGPARGCASCHRSPEALGLGAGRVEPVPGGWAMTAAGPALADGLSADAWTDLQGTRGGEATRPGDRPLDPQALSRVLAAPIGGP